MPIGGGKYEDETTAIRKKTHAQGVILAIIDGDKGTGFSAQASFEVQKALPKILKDIAVEMEEDLRKLNLDKREVKKDGLNKELNKKIADKVEDLFEKYNISNLIMRQCKRDNLPFVEVHATAAISVSMLLLKGVLQIVEKD